MEPANRPRPWLEPALAVLVLLAALGPSYAFARAVAFGSWSAIDDQGYLLVTLRSFFQGFALYDDVFTHYGPTYYLFESTLHGVTGWTLSHESIRHGSIGLWLASCLLLSGGVYRWTRSLALAALVHVLALHGLECVGTDSGHPQGVAAFLISAFVFVESGERSGSGGVGSPATALARGALVAALLLTKINTGVFLLASVLLAIAWSRSGRLARAASLGLSLGALALPAVLMRSRLDLPGVLAYALVVTLALLSILVRAPRASAGEASDGTRRSGRRVLAAGALGFVVAGGGLVAWTLAKGTTLEGLVNGVALRNLGFTTAYFADARLGLPHVAVAVVSCGLVLGTRLSKRGLSPRLLTALRAGFAAGTLVRFATFDVGYRDLAPVLGFGAPLLWLALPSPREAIPTGRLALVLAAALQTLVAYPVAGAQVALSVFLFLPVAALCLFDALASVRASLEVRLGPTRSGTLARVTSGIVVGLALALLLAFAWRETVRYRSRSPLVLPGTRGLRVPERTAASLEWVTHNLREISDTVTSIPGLNSFAIWTGEPTPTHVNTTTWMTVLTLAEEDAIVAALEAHPRACAVRNAWLMQFWLRGRDVRERPLVHYLTTRFVPIASLNGYELLVRRERAAPALTYCARVLASSGEDEPWGGQLEVRLPALGPVPVARIVIHDGESDATLYDTADEHGGSLQLVGARGASPDLALDVRAPRELVLEARGRDPRKVAFPVLRLLDARGEALGSVPLLLGP